ncbi:MAG: ASKHA domain-containing protein [SAR324 cluster bacterium]|nr:ASKHA domain-containing protein [SAR324 cluster bacterium]
MGTLIHGGRRLELAAGKTIFDYADDLAVRVPTSCGRSGECHECIVEIERGTAALTPPTEAEAFLRGNYRLACQARVADADAEVEFSVLRRQPRILTHAIHRPVTPEPLVERRGGQVLLGGEPIGRYRGRILGLAIDLGTTTVAMNLVDLESGATLHTASFENPQRFGGSDVMHRISYDSGPHRGELQKVMLAAINFEIGEMTRSLGISRHQIYEVAAVGNATLRDLFFGLDVAPIGETPYRSTIETEFREGRRATTALTVEAKALGLRIGGRGSVYGGPLIGSHVGADVAAGLLAVGMDEATEPAMLVDVGTNTEVVVGHPGRMLAASCPAGPAFEGGEIAHGMPGYPGAVESVEIRDGAVRTATIDGAEVQGICGSGLVDLLAELRRTGGMNELGVLSDGAMEFPFAPERGMTLSRADISALAQAKSANFCGQYIVLRRYGLPLERIGKLSLAGGFANYIDVENAVRIGFLANLPIERIVKVGNAALEGATILLLSVPMRRRIEALVATIEHVELETTEDFFDIFVEGCQFKPMPDDFV